MNYTTIKSRNIIDAVETSSKIEKAQRTINTHEGSQWEVLCGSLESAVNWSKAEDMTDDKELNEYLKNSLAKVILDSGYQVPEKYNSKKGPKWSANPETKGLFKYVSDIKTVVKAGMAAVLLPGNDQVAARCDILKEAKEANKTPETPLQALKRHVSAIDQLIAKLDPRDYSEAFKEFQRLAPHAKTISSN